MKAYFDDNASLCVDAENSAEKAALLLFFSTPENAIDGNANCNARSVTKSASE